MERVRFPRFSFLRCSFALKLLFAYLVIVMGTFSEHGGGTVAVSEAGKNDHRSYGFSGIPGIWPPSADSFRQTLSFLSSDGRLDQKLSADLKTLRDSFLRADVVELAKDVLDSGVLHPETWGVFGSNFYQLHGQSDGDGGGPRALDAGDDDNNINFVDAVDDDDGGDAVQNSTAATLTNMTTFGNVTSPSNVTAAVNVTTSPTPANVTTAMPGPPVNHLCVNHTAAFLVALAEKEPWAQRMIDADGKPGPNLEGLQFFWIGDYEECTKVEAKSKEENKTLYKGRYCTAIMPLFPNQPLIPIMPAVPPSGLRIGLCVPDSCSGLDITLILNEVLASRNISLRVGLTTCQQETVDYDTKAIVVLFICSLFLLVMVAGTAYDVIMLQRPKWKKEEEMETDILDSSHHNVTAASSNGYGSTSSDTTPVVVNVKSSEEEQPLLRKGVADGGAGVGAPTIGVLGKMLVAFSVYTNGSKILNATHSPGSITCIHGIRFISMTWVILGHTFAFGVTTSANYATYLNDSLGLWTFQAIVGAPVTVDTFFVLSGLLVTYLILKELDKRHGKMQWFLFYFHRFWRLTPPYAFVMMVYVPLFRYFGSGPNWLQDGAEQNYCRDSWWTNLLYVNNFVKVKEMCIAWSWYLSNDMQFYVVSPLIFLPLFRWRKVGLVLASLWLLATVITAGVIARVNKFPPTMSLNTAGGDVNAGADYFFDFYIKPYCRFGPYVVGMLTGYALYVTKCKVRMNLLVSLSGWAVATAVGLSVVYGLHGAANGHPLTNDVSAFYNAMHRTVWGASVCWVIFACATGHGGPVNALLSWNALIPLSRLTYMAYLVHPIIINLYHLGAPSLFYMSHFHCAMLFLAFTVAAFAVAFILSLAFEAPMMGLEKVLLSSRQSKH